MFSIFIRFFGQFWQNTYLIFHLSGSPGSTPNKYIFDSIALSMKYVNCSLIRLVTARIRRMGKVMFHRRVYVHGEGVPQSLVPGPFLGGRGCTPVRPVAGEGDTPVRPLVGEGGTPAGERYPSQTYNRGHTRS